jgi:hypothetical protein
MVRRTRPSRAAVASVHCRSAKAQGIGEVEALILLLDAIALVILAHWSIINDARGPDEPSIGLFRFVRQAAPPAASSTPRPAATQRPVPTGKLFH